jgi:hypothetical protein
MYLRHLLLQNVKLLRHVNISFTRNNNARPWTVFVGENGLCKTTILQAIALAASGITLASELADVLSLPDRRLPDKSATGISAIFDFGTSGHAQRTYPGYRKRPNPPWLNSMLLTQVGWREFVGGSSYTVKQFLSRLGADLKIQGIDPLRDARRKQLPAWFVAGYGAMRSLPRPKSAREEDFSDPIKHRLSNLFDRGTLIATAFADLLKPEMAHAYNRILKQVLLNSGLLPRVTNLELLRAQGGISSAHELQEAHLFQFDLGKSSVSVPATWLSRGYQGTIAWIADLVGHLLLDAGKPLEPEEMEGLVLVDELDLHLHPKWQAALIPALKKTFPRLQFICTTHSAMLLPGLEQDEILLLKQDDEGSVYVETASESPALMTGSEIFDTFFGIHRLYPNDLGQALQRYGYLASNPYRSSAEEQELHGLLERLKQGGVAPGWTPVPRVAQATATGKEPPNKRPGKKSVAKKTAARNKSVAKKTAARKKSSRTK